MSKNNLRGITLDIGPILGIHSLTLIISCLFSFRGSFAVQSGDHFRSWEQLGSFAVFGQFPEMLTSPRTGESMK